MFPMNANQVQSINQSYSNVSQPNHQWPTYHSTIWEIPTVDEEVKELAVVLKSDEVEDHSTCQEQEWKNFINYVELRLIFHT